MGMGGVCASCSPRAQFMSVYDQIFKESKIRAISAKDWIDIIKRKTSRGSVNQKNWYDIYNNNLTTGNIDNEEVWKNVCQRAYEDAVKEKTLYLLVSSFLFLCQKNSQLVKQNFV